jgi:hypothetical protein
MVGTVFLGGLFVLLDVLNEVGKRVKAGLGIALTAANCHACFLG